MEWVEERQQYEVNDDLGISVEVTVCPAQCAMNDFA
jgi:hypothetical protein